MRTGKGDMHTMGGIGGVNKKTECDNAMNSWREYETGSIEPNKKET